MPILDHLYASRDGLWAVLAASDSVRPPALLDVEAPGPAVPLPGVRRRLLLLGDAKALMGRHGSTDLAEVAQREWARRDAAPAAPVVAHNHDRIVCPACGTAHLIPAGGDRHA